MTSDVNRGLFEFDPAEPVHVYCCRCVIDDAFWLTTDDYLEDSVEQHVADHHRGAPGPARPDGTPIWVPDEDWWLVSEEDEALLRSFSQDLDPPENAASRTGPP